MEVVTTDNMAAFGAIQPAQTGTFGARAGARVIDWLVGTVVGYASGIVAGLILALLAASGAVNEDWVYRVQSANIFGNMAWGLIAIVLAESVSEGIAGATVGKLILGYRVVTTNLAPCTPVAALIRSLAYFVDSFFFGLPAYSSMQNSSHNQRLGDKWAGTVVAKAAALPPHAKREGPLLVIGIVAGLVVHGIVIMVSVIAKVF